MMVTKINVILGSVREPSMGNRLFTYLKNNRLELEAENGIQLTFIKVGDYQLKPYNQPIPPLVTPEYPNNLPENAKQWVNDVSDADGVLILAPEYDYSIPGALKTALDYLAKGMDGKPVQVISYSMGTVGGLLGMMALLPVFQVLNMITLNHNLQLANIQKVFAEDGNFIPELAESEQVYYRNRIAQIIKNISHYSELLK
ncbi:NADPH-dependent FMN reductase [Fructilactobacillus sanfranciscensis]|uniref:NADPH-dependent FMN reductase-like domain-containing protein n=1 Tax=Fructilactobacillus sanfranciscensis TaxID=1625 RepID=A0A5C4TJM0_FRUSA|nr:NADPH-dependent FMN reductase [Fructilactobacillus sanfranciscensis]TNK90146.1 hypothetical protein DID87_05285 [Fructilactobacillus sanfranciscensis]